MISTMVRTAVGEDADAIANLKVICWRETYKGLMPQEILDGLDADAETPHWRSWLEDDEAGLIAKVIIENNVLIGYGLAGPMRKEDRMGDKLQADGEIYALYVHPDHQRRGVGSQLFASLVAVMLEKQFEQIGLWMLKGNGKAESFYKKVGGIEAGKRIEIQHGRIAFGEKGWSWTDLKALQARLNLRAL